MRNQSIRMVLLFTLTCFVVTSMIMTSNRISPREMVRKDAVTLMIAYSNSNNNNGDDNKNSGINNIDSNSEIIFIEDNNNYNSYNNNANTRNSNLENKNIYDNSKKTNVIHNKDDNNNKNFNDDNNISHLNHGDINYESNNVNNNNDVDDDDDDNDDISFDHRYPINPKTVCHSKRVELVICVAVARHASEQRQAIRETWGRYATEYNSNNNNQRHNNSNSNGNDYNRRNKNNVHYNKKSFIQLLFFIGQDHNIGTEKFEMSQHHSNNHNNQIENKIRIESRHYGDIVQGSFIDSYQNLTLKSISMLRWIQTYCPQARFFLKVDDDVYVNVPKLLEKLKEAQQNVGKSTAIVFGNVIRNKTPRRNSRGKWSVPSSRFPNKTYPDYTMGAAYVISKEAYPGLLKATYDLSVFWIEDVFVTGLCGERAGVVRVHEKLRWRPSFDDVPCDIKKYCYVLGYTPNQLRSVHGALKKCV